MSYVCKERLIETIRQRTCIELCPQKMACHDDLRGECTVNDVIEIVKGFEPDEVDEVKHCKWVEQPTFDGTGAYVLCNNCGYDITTVVNFLESPLVKLYKYCPHCGARMDGE